MLKGNQRMTEYFKFKDHHLDLYKFFRSSHEIQERKH